jgi:Predicted membrane protein (DUF2232)
MTAAETPHAPVVLRPRTPGRTVRSVLGYAVSTALMFISPLVLFVPAALLNCILRNGRRAAWVALGGAAALLAALSFSSSTPHALGPAGIADIVALVLAVGVPTLLISSLVRHGVPFGSVVLTGTGASASGFLLTELILRTTSGFSPYLVLVQNLRQNSATWLEAYRRAQVPPEALRVMKSWSDSMASGYLPALLMIPTVLMFVLSLVMLTRLPAWRDHVMSRSSAELQRLSAGPYLFRNLSLPDWLLFAFILGGLSPLATGVVQKIGGNILAVVGFLYLLQGLAVFRSLLLTIGAGVGGATIAWMTLALLTLSGIAPLLLSIAGLFDSFFDFRHFKRKDGSHESHID